MSGAWPALPLAEWRDTYASLHRWTQIVGKVRLAVAPPVNHWWHITLYVTPRGLTTSAMPAGDRTFEIAFDLHDHRLDVTTSDDERRSIDLAPMAVADFLAAVRSALDDLGIEARIRPSPQEIFEEAIPFDEDRLHTAYDRAAARRFHDAIVQADRVIKEFRDDFIGKASPVHFFWGGFDLAATRFSGRVAPTHPGVPGVADSVTREGYSHEVWSAGWWPGGGLVQEAAFYAYAYPAPAGFPGAAVEPAGAYWTEEMGLWVLPWEAVRAAPDADARVLAFLRSTYASAADLGAWDRAALERPHSNGGDR